MAAILVEKYYDKVASMLAVEVPHAQIAAVTGLSEAEIGELVNNDSIKTLIQENALASYNKYETLNEGWDMMENLGMNGVLAHLQMNPDPDFALKAATLANKAQRRGQHKPGNVIPGQAGVRAVINLSANFINQLQQNLTITQTKPIQLVKKDSNFLAPKAVASLLKPLEEEEQSTEVFDDLHLEGA